MVGFRRRQKRHGHPGIRLSAFVHSSCSLFNIQYSATTMATARKFADHTRYHLAPRGFWKKFRQYTRIFDFRLATSLTQLTR